MTEPQREWRKMKYYPVSIEKLQNATMREAAYLIAPMNIGEDYEYFDEVKHLLEIPAKIFDAERPRKSIEEISQELDEKFDALIKTTKEKFEYSKVVAEKRYNEKFDRIIENFEYAKDKGHFPLTYTIGTLDGSYFISNSSGAIWTQSFVIKQGEKHEGYYTFGNRKCFKYYMPDKPNPIVRFFMRTCLGFYWVDEKGT